MPAIINLLTWGELLRKATIAVALCMELLVQSGLILTIKDS